jgi:Na+/proline symporter
VILLERIPGGFSEVMAVGSAAGKFQFFDFAMDIARSYTFWAGVIGGAFLTTSTHGTDQYMVQRYLCSKNARQASAALLTSGVIVFVQFLMFLMIGVMLFVYYGQHATLPAEITPDRVFSHFISTELMTGVKGLVIAAMLAAAMSSSLNALASTALADFYQPLFAPNRSETHYLRVSHVLTAVWGAVQIAAALYMIGKEKRIVDIVLTIASFTNGPILGVFFLGTLTKRVRRTGALAGILTGIAVVSFVWLRMNVSWQWYVLIGSAVTFIVGYVTSAMFERGSVAATVAEERI